MNFIELKNRLKRRLLLSESGFYLFFALLLYIVAAIFSLVDCIRGAWLCEIFFVGPSDHGLTQLFLHPYDGYNDYLLAIIDYISYLTIIWLFSWIILLVSKKFPIVDRIIAIPSKVIFGIMLIVGTMVIIMTILMFPSSLQPQHRFFG